MSWVVRLCGAGAVAAMLAASAAEPRIVSSHSVPRSPLNAAVRLGGLSDLTVVPGAREAVEVWSITDRGPNGTTAIDGERVRTLLAPEFVPSLVKLKCSRDDTSPAEVRTVLPLRDADGSPASGRPPGRDRLVRDDDHAPIAPDPRGVDPEAVVALADGSFWIAEEYRPALLRVAADGRVLARFVPRGSAVADDRDVLPAIYAKRRENRGFEALAAAGDGRLWALLQSPLDAPGRAAGKRTGNVRLLALDAEAGLPVAEHVYRLGDPADPAYRTHGAPPDDGKLCAMAALDARTLLVLEQDDGGMARLYAIDVSRATDTLARADDTTTLEEIADLAAARIEPVRKTLVADLTHLRERMRAEVDEGTAGGGALKIEGLAVVDGRRIAVVNDDDFGVAQAASGGVGRRTMVWIVELPADLATVSAAARPESE